MNSRTINCMIGAACALLIALTPLAIADAGKPKYAVKDVMKEIHKGEENIGKRVLRGEASKDDLAKLVEYYEALPLNAPPRGELASWKEKTGALVNSARKLKAGEAGAIDAYKNAANCKACHNQHRPE